MVPGRGRAVQSSSVLGRIARLSTGSLMMQASRRANICRHRSKAPSASIPCGIHKGVKLCGDSVPRVNERSAKFSRDQNMKLVKIKPTTDATPETGDEAG